jgi:outer membrane murein-binding lipoprotein Lpp
LSRTTSPQGMYRDIKQTLDYYLPLCKEICELEARAERLEKERDEQLSQIQANPKDCIALLEHLTSDSSTSDKGWMKKIEDALQGVKEKNEKGETKRRELVEKLEKMIDEKNISLEEKRVLSVTVDELTARVNRMKEDKRQSLEDAKNIVRDLRQSSNGNPISS